MNVLLNKHELCDNYFTISSSITLKLELTSHFLLLCFLNTPEMYITDNEHAFSLWLFGIMNVCINVKQSLTHVLKYTNPNSTHVMFFPSFVSHIYQI